MKFINALVALSIVITGCGTQQPPTTGATPQPPGRKLPGEVGNGGHGVVIDGKIYLFDLVEAGIERSPQIDLNAEANSPNSFADLLKKQMIFSNESDKALFPFLEIGAKLSELYSVDPIFTMSLMTTLRMYQWKFLHRDLLTLPVEGKIVNLDEGSVVLVANRRGRSIYLSRPAFQRMDKANAAATVLHEVLYALIQPVPVLQKDGSTLLVQNAARVREITGSIFSSRAKYDVAKFRMLVSPAEYPRLKDNEGILFATTGGVMNAGFTGVEDYRTIYSGAQTMLSGGLEGKTATLSPSAVTHETLNKFLADPADAADPIEEFCKVLIDAPGSVGVTLGHIPEGQENGNVGVKLNFADYQDGNEVKTYVKFEWRNDLPPVKTEFLLTAFVLKDCVATMRVVAWDMHLRMFPSTLPLNEKNPYFKLAAKIDRARAPIGYGFKLEDLE